jgi:hypothetical protein
MKLSLKNRMLVGGLELEAALTQLLTWSDAETCLDGFELVNGRCKASCSAGPSEVLGADGDCLLPQARLIESYFVFCFSMVVWCYVIFRISSPGRSTRSLKRLILLIKNKIS